MALAARLCKLGANLLTCDLKLPLSGQKGREMMQATGSADTLREALVGQLRQAGSAC